MKMVPSFNMDPLIKATVEAVEEAIINVLVAAETMTGYQGHTAHALPHETLLKVLERYRPK
jgi:D-aminopeptidase